MKRCWLLIACGALLTALGLHRLDRATLPSLLASRLEHELSQARERGHPSRVLVMDDEATLKEQATKFARESGATVLGISPETSLIVPSAADRAYASQAAWSAVAYNVCAPFLRNRDLPGAAAALVRRYTDELTRRGVLDALPPRAPIFLPDIERHPDYPGESWLAGVGLLLMISAGYGLGLSLRARWNVSKSNGADRAF